MGAEVFFNVESGKNAKEAFANAVDEAQYNYGHAGYTGSIAEKDDFTLLVKDPFESEDEAYRYAERLIDEGDDRVDDKWGPAGCVSFKHTDGSIRYLFFGWASS